MTRYLDYLDSLKDKYIRAQNAIGQDIYPSTQFYYYEDITYEVEAGIRFCQSLKAVKLAKTAIVLVDLNACKKVYFSDDDIISIIETSTNEGLKSHIIMWLKKVVNKKGLFTLTFHIHERTFNLKGIPFDEKFNDVLCDNPADIDMNGNDLIALINLVLEKERTDKTRNKLIKTAKKYLGLS